MSGAPELAEAADNVVLLDSAGLVLGEEPRAAVHTTTTPRHLGFSLYLFDDADQLLITCWGDRL
jgi:isopentenyl-diphosphate delta-isomerase